MILDENVVLFDNVAVTSASVLSNILDLRATANATLATGSFGVGAGAPIYCVIVLPTAMTTSTSATLDFTIRTSDSLSGGALSSPITVFDSGVLSAATMVAGYYVFSGILPVSGMKQYMDINATLATGTMTAGTINAFLTDAVPSLNIPLYSINSGAAVV